MDLWIPGAPDPKQTAAIRQIVDDYTDAQFERKPHGVIFRNGQEVAHTLQCVHCATHYVSRKGSGMRRGWCVRCGGPLCGKRSCLEHCTPWVAECGGGLFGREF